MQMIECLSPNYNARPDGDEVSMLIMHTTCMVDTRLALDRLCDPDSKVSAHYVIDEEGQVYRLVDESNGHGMPELLFGMVKRM